MNIVLISPYPPEIDGLAPYSANLARQYEVAGHRVKTIDTGRASASRSAGSLSIRPRNLIGLVRLMRRLRPDLVHVQHTIAGYGLLVGPLWLLTLVARLRGSRIVVTHHEVTRDIGRLGLIGRLYYSAIGRLATDVHVHTQEARAVLDRSSRHARGRVMVSPHPVPPLRRDPSGAKALRSRLRIGDCLVLLHFGFIHVDKGIDSSIAAYQRLLLRRPDLAASTRLVIAGDVRRRPAGFGRFETEDRAYAQSLEDTVASAGLSDSVLFTGPVPDEDVCAWFTLADLVLLPYVKGEQSGVANEAIAAEVPVLATPLPGLRELLGDLPSVDDTAAEPYSRTMEGAIDDIEALRLRSKERYGRVRTDGDAALLVRSLTDPERERADAP